MQKRPSTSFQSWLFGCGSRARTFVLNATGSAHPRVGTEGAAFNWAIRWEREEQEPCRWHRCESHQVQKRLSTSFQSWLFGCGSRALTLVLNAMGSAQPRVGTVHVAFSWTFRWESEEREPCRWHHCGAHHVRKRPSTSFQSWLFSCGSRARTFVLNATGSAQPPACIVDVAFNWTIR